MPFSQNKKEEEKPMEVLTKRQIDELIAETKSI